MTETTPKESLTLAEVISPLSQALEETSTIHSKLIDVQKELVEEGIAKGHKSKQGYKYRGIEEALAACSKAMVNNGVHWTYKILEKKFYTQELKGKVQYFLELYLSFNFYSEDGGSVEQQAFGVQGGFDCSKLYGQLTSYLVKETLFKKFLIPVEGMNLDDPDSFSATETPLEAPQASKRPSTPPAKKNFSEAPKNPAKETTDTGLAKDMHRLKTARVELNLEPQDVLTFTSFLFDGKEHPSQLTSGEITTLIDYMKRIQSDPPKKS